MRNPKFNKLLDQMREIHERKNTDYANESDPYSNFTFSAKFAGVSQLQVYAVLLGVKMARLQELLGKGKVPKNESINDTLLDFSTYAALMASNLMIPSIGDELATVTKKTRSLFDHIQAHRDFINGKNLRPRKRQSRRKVNGSRRSPGRSGGKKASASGRTNRRKG